MRTYTFVTDVTISVHVEVRAESLSEAIAAAKEAPIMTLCNFCATENTGEWCTSGEIDGSPDAGPLVDLYINDEEPEAEEFQAAKTEWAAS